MKTSGLVFRFLPALLGVLAFSSTAVVVGLKVVHERKRQSAEAMEAQWNETERLSLAWSEAADTLARGLADVSELSVAVDVAGTEVRHVSGIGEGNTVWQNLAPGTALTLRTGTAGRFEGRLANGGFLLAKDMGLKSFPTPGEGTVFLRRPQDGLVYALAPQPDRIVLAALPPTLFAKLFSLKDPRTAYALVNTAGPWVSQTLPARAPLGSGQVLHTSDTVGFGQQTFAQGNVRALLEGPSRFEMNERVNSFNTTFTGMGSAPIAGTNLRVVTRWSDEFHFSRLLEPVAQDLALVSVSVLLLTGLVFIDRARLLAASRGLRDSVRAILYQREMPDAGQWALATFVKDEFRDILGNVNRVTFAHRALHHWGRAWAGGFDSVEEEARILFRPAQDVASELGFSVNVTHDTEWQVHMAAAPALEAAMLLVMRNVDFRTDLLRTMLTHGIEPLARPTRRIRKDSAREALVEWLGRASALVHDEDPLVWGVFYWGAGKASENARWELLGKSARKGLSIDTEHDPQRLQWGDELIAEIAPGNAVFAEPGAFQSETSGGPAVQATPGETRKPKRQRPPRLPRQVTAGDTPDAEHAGEEKAERAALDPVLDTAIDEAFPHEKEFQPEDEIARSFADESEDSERSAEPEGTQADATHTGGKDEAEDENPDGDGRTKGIGRAS